MKTILTCLITGMLLGAQLFAVDVSAAVFWYDSLGFPDAKDLPYVHVATGSYMIRGNNPPENRFVDGFLVSEDAEGFTVFLCSPPDFEDGFGTNEPYPPLTTVRFERKTDGPPHQQVNYEVLDFQKIVTELLAKVHDIQSGPKDFQQREKAFGTKYHGLWPTFDFTWGRPLAHRARLFSFARACQQKNLAGPATELFDLAANIPDEQTHQVDPTTLRTKLQQQMGDAVLKQTETEFGNTAIPLTEIAKTYESFAAHYPAHSRLAYAQESAKLLRTMIEEEAAHHPKPLGEMSSAEQVAENIYQLRHQKIDFWIAQEHYPVTTDRRDGKDVITPIHRLVDLGNAAVPQLIDALDNRRFTRSLEPRFNGLAEPRAMRVSDIAQHVLEHLSGRNFYAGRSKDGKPATATTKQLAEAWWREVNGKGEKQTLIEATSAGKGEGLQPARVLVEKFPNDALPAIEAALRVTSQPGYRGEYVEVAGLLPGDLPLAFLRGQLAPEHDVYSQVHAAQALLHRGKPEAVPAIIEAWHQIQPRLPRNEEEAFFQAGEIISFLATSGDPRAIDALAMEAGTGPVQARYAVVEVFYKGSYNGGGSGPQISVRDHVENLPAGEAEEAAERLLIASLDDTERFFGPEGNFGKVSFADPRVCDLAAFVLANRWPGKYAFQWSGRTAECDPQITKMREKWRADHAMPTLPIPAPAAAITPAADYEVAPLLETYLSAKTESQREESATRIVESLGLRALPLVRTRLEQSKDATLRPLALRLAAIVTDVQVTKDPGRMTEKSSAASFRGKVLTGTWAEELGHRLESEMPKDVSVVTFNAERAGNGTGFWVTIGWLPGTVDLHAGWSRELAVRAGDKTVYRDIQWSAERGTNRTAVFRKMAEAFDQAVQAEIDARVLLHFRLQRGTAE